MRSFRRFFAENHEECLDTQQLQATILMRRGRYLEAKLPLEAVLSSRKEAKGKTHRSTVSALRSIGDCLVGLGKYEQALPIFGQVPNSFEEGCGERSIWMWLVVQTHWDTVTPC